MPLPLKPMTNLSQLERALRDPAAVSEPLTIASFSNLATRLQRLLGSGSVDELREADKALLRLLDSRWQQLTPESKHALAEPDTPIARSFEAGKLSFASLMISLACSRRAPERFAVQMKRTAFAPYIAAMRSGEKSNAELSQLTGEADETVSRKLKLLREASITGFRKEGRTVLNHLTPAALIFAGGPHSVLHSSASAPELAAADRAIWRQNMAPIRDVVPESRKLKLGFKGHPTIDAFGIPKLKKLG